MEYIVLDGLEGRMQQVLRTGGRVITSDRSGISLVIQREQIGRESRNPSGRKFLVFVKWAGEEWKRFFQKYTLTELHIMRHSGICKKCSEEPDGNIILFSAVKIKEYEEMISYLCKHADAEEYVVTLTDGDRATDAHYSGELFGNIQNSR